MGLEDLWIKPKKSNILNNNEDDDTDDNNNCINDDIEIDTVMDLDAYYNKLHKSKDKEEDTKCLLF